MPRGTDRTRAKATARLQQTQTPHVLLAGQEDKWNDHPGELAGRRSKEEGRSASVEADLNGLRGELIRAGQGVVDSELRMRELRETPPRRPELEPDLAAAFESESRGPRVYRQRAARSRQELKELMLPSFGCDMSYSAFLEA